MNIETENLESVVKCYVLGQLSDVDAEEFETYFLSRPDVADMVDSVQQLRIGMENIESELKVDSQANARIGTSKPWLTRLTGLFSGPVPAFAMLALSIGLAPLALKGLSSSDSSMDVQLVNVSNTTVRSAGTTPSIDLSAAGQHAAVLVRVKQVEFPNYVLRVASAEKGDKLWSSEPFAFTSGSRDQLVIIPPQGARDNVVVKLYGVSESGDESAVEFCNYTEACF